MQWARVLAVTMLFVLSWNYDAVSQAASKSQAKSTTPTVKITERDNGTDVDLPRDGALIVRLPSNPSTGYRWAIAGDPAPLRLEKTTYSKSSRPSQNVGGGGTEVLRLSASSAGMATLTVVYRRTWEYNAPPAKTFSVRVNVR